MRGACVHNLKHIDVDIPHHALTVITGLSGSGKSSLAFDTLYAEGQRRYVETFSPYTRQFLERVDKPAVDRIEGIPPAIAIEQANAVKTSRSTVGSMTEIADYLKMLFPRLAQLICPQCRREIRPWSAPEIAAKILGEWPGQEVLIAFVVPFPIGTKLHDAFSFIQAQGFLRVWQNGQVRRLDEPPALDEIVDDEIIVIQDRLRLEKTGTSRLTEAIESALPLGKGVIRFLATNGNGVTTQRRFANRWHCPDDHLDFAEPTPSLFSFNNPLGACPACRGFGRVIEIDFQRALPDRSLSIRQGVVKAFQGAASSECQRDLLKACQTRGIPMDKPFHQLTKAQQKFVIEGEVKNTRSLNEIWEAGGWYGVKGYFDWLETKSYKMHVRVLLSRYRDYRPCPTCHGARFQPATLNFKLRVSETASVDLAQVNALPLSEAWDLFRQFKIPAQDEAGRRLREEIVVRLGYLVEVGLGYLTLDRATRTLSGGEIERVNLTSCLGNSLVNTLFVLDEPTIGLHPRDTAQLISIIQRLRDRGNTVVVVEHEEAIMRQADHLIDLGPGRGEQGGTVTYAGDFAGMLSSASSLTGRYLSGFQSIPRPVQRRPIGPKSPRLSLEKANLHNVRQLDAEIPLRAFVVVTGVSGSGKSTLVNEVLYETLQRLKKEPTVPTEMLRALRGHEAVSEIIRVDQSPLTKTPRSNAALYLGVYDSIRELFAQTESAQAQGFTASTFSFNGGFGRCPRCSGTGCEKIEMQFLADVFLTCPTCEGKRFQSATLTVRYRQKNIHDVLEMTVETALNFFHPQADGINEWTRTRHIKICGALDLLRQVGLIYLRLGQPLNQLSGGEAQRIKLISYLSEAKPVLEGKEAEDGRESRVQEVQAKSTTRLFVLDEPTTGLHFEDIRQLLELFQRMVNHGDSLLVIEHNLDVIKCADWVIELGPEAGFGGGQIVVAGTPEQVAAHATSHTGRFLAEKLVPVSSSIHEASRAAGPKISRPLPSTKIEIRQARHHNLKSFSLDLNLGDMTVITGLSGSGKSTLAFDLLFAEGQRRYLDSLNAYARQFVEQLEKPDVDSITGLPPAVAIEQRLTRGGRKSTVATVTEIYQFARLLFAKLGVPHDSDSGEAAVRQSPAQIIARLEKQLMAAQELTLLAPLIKARKGLHTEIARWAEKKKYPALRVDGKWVEPAKFKPLSRFTEHTIDVALGNINRRMPVKERTRLIESALLLGRHTFYALDNHSRQTIYSTSLFCPGTGRSFEELDPRLFSFNSAHGWCPACQGYGTYFHVRTTTDTAIEQEIEIERACEQTEADVASLCLECQGTRLNPVARAVRLPMGKWAETGGPTLPELGAMTVRRATQYFRSIKLQGRAAAVARDLLPEIRQRLRFLAEVGLDYLTLDRSADTLSGGESQRIRLAAQLGSNLQGVLYVLDEPTIGLHPRDNDRLLDSLQALKAKGNTLVVVEHDAETMKRADRIIDLGPGAGKQGGYIVGDGTWQELAENKTSITGQLLGEPLRHPSRGERRPCLAKTEWLEIRGAARHNLKNLDVKIPLGRLTVVCGVSGAGKSTLVQDVVKPAVLAVLAGQRKKSSFWKSVKGAETLASVCEVDQSPIGKTSRSTPATYLGLMDDLRELYAQVPLARQRGYTAGRFSYNTAGGRCENCQGQGVIKVEMQFLPTVFLPCESCASRRFNAETLQVLFNEKSVADVLAMSVDEAVDFLSGVPRLQRPLQLLQKTGLGYLTLGQSSPTLSGGESQRLKLVAELAHSLEVTLQKRFASRAFLAPRNLYLLEEPTIGLHLRDVQRLLELVQELVEAGHTVVVIEHHLDVIAEADHVIELGPEAGDDGGQIVAAGAPEILLRTKMSRTGPYLKSVLPQGR